MTGEVAVPAVSDGRWALIRKLYGGDWLTVGEISALAGVPERTLYHRAKIESWPNRPRRGAGRGLEPGARMPEQLAEADAELAEVERPALIELLWRMLDRKVREMERRRSPRLDLKPVQEMTALARTLEKLIDAEREAARRKEPKHDDDGSGDPGAMLAELARRIEALP